MLESINISFKFPDGYNNAFEKIGISRNIMMLMSLAVMSLDILKENFINPALTDIISNFAPQDRQNNRKAPAIPHTTQAVR
jgi:hypothetical protein